MAQSDRDELAELARSLWAHLEWQRDLGVAGFERTVTLAPMVEGAGPASARVERPAAPAVRPHTETKPAAPAFEPEPTPGGAPRFEMPSFLKKKPAMPSGPPPAAAPPTPRAPVAAEPIAKPPSAPPAVTPPPAPARAATPPPGGQSILLADAAEAPTSKITDEPVVEGPERIQRLAVIQQRVSGCAKCRLNEGRTQTVFSRGNPFAPLAFVGEGPGRDEDIQGQPFVGAAGQLLDKIIAAMGLGADDVYICNVVKCRPPNNRVPAPDEMSACGPYLVQQLGLVRPKFIVALGKTASGYLLQSVDSMARLRGRWHSWQGIPLLATWHPAYLLRTPAAKKDTWDDMKLVLEKMGRPVPKGGGTR